MLKFFSDLKKRHHPSLGALEILKYVGPGFIVTVGFIDPGNWAANLAAGSFFGYSLLWIVTLSTLMLIILQHNAAHLGIATGLCLSEATNKTFRPAVAKPLLASAMLASVSTSFAEITGGAIALNMLFKIPFRVGAFAVTCLALFLLLSNSYRKMEKIIIAFVSLIGLSFVYELALINVDWGAAATGWIKPAMPDGSMLIILSILGAVVMPHNLFLHSEIIQSRKWNLEKEAVIEKQLKYEFFDTLLSMLAGWAINSAMVIMAAAVFFKSDTPVDRLEQAGQMLIPLLGNKAGLVFALALLFSGISSSVTSGMAGASIFAGMHAEPMDLKDNHSRLGMYISLLGALTLIMFVTNPFKALIASQMVLCLQLPFTIFPQIYLTSSKKLMGAYANAKWTISVLLAIGFTVTWLNLKMLLSF